MIKIFRKQYKIVPVLLVDVLVFIFSDKNHERKCRIKFWEQLKRVARRYYTKDLVDDPLDETNLIWDIASDFPMQYRQGVSVPLQKATEPCPSSGCIHPKRPEPIDENFDREVEE